MLPPLSIDELCFETRRILDMIRDPQSSATRLGRVIDTIRTLAWLVIDDANDRLAGRARIGSTAHAVAVLGMGRLEQLVRRFLYKQLDRITLEHPDLRASATQAAIRYGML